MTSENDELILTLKNLKKSERAFIISRACLRIWPIAYVINGIRKNSAYPLAFNGESLLLAFRANFGLFFDTGNPNFDSLIKPVSSRLLHRSENEIRYAQNNKYDLNETIVSLYRLLAVACQCVLEKEDSRFSEYDFLQALENLSLLTLVSINDIEQIDINQKWQLILNQIQEDIKHIGRYVLKSGTHIHEEPRLWSLDDRILLSYSDEFFKFINKLPHSWGLWSDWYDSKLKGIRNEELYAGISKAYEFEEIWDGRANSINKIIIKFIKEASNTFNELGNEIPPEIPDKKPASLLIEWVDGKLVSVNGNINSPLGPDKFDEAKQALKGHFNDFLNALSGENADLRFVNFTTDLSNQIPDSNSSNTEIFSFGHKLNILKAYSSTITAECSSLTGAIFQSLLIAYDETVKQIPSWNEFKRNSSIETLQGEDTTGILNDLTLFNETLINEENSDFIDKTITRDLDAEIREVRKSAKVPEVKDNSPYIVEVVQDLLYSAENIIKEISKKAVEYVKSLASKSAKKASEEFDGEVVKGFGKLGKWSAKLIVYGLPTLLAKTYLLPFAIENWPWLKPLIDFLKSAPIFK